jgi:KDO2-lipid IV(A) lauroyltransferase
VTTEFSQPRRREAWEFAGVVVFFTVLRWLPRRVARALGAGLAWVLYQVQRHWRAIGDFNLRLAFPETTLAERERILRAAFRQWGWLAAEFARFPGHTARTIEEVIVYDGFENYAAAAARGKGVLYLTAHFSAWELSSFAHSLHGHPLSYVNRPLDNARVDALVNRYRCLGGNRAIDRRSAARAILETLRAGGAVGILMDQNVLTSDPHVFAPFFGVPASTTTGLARFALRTGAAVVPVLVIWDEALGKYRLRFDPALELVQTGDDERDVAENTALFNRVLEDYIRRYPEQWLWIHRRWATRPPGEPPVYQG